MRGDSERVRLNVRVNRDVPSKWSGPFRRGKREPFKKRKQRPPTGRLPDPRPAGDVYTLNARGAPFYEIYTGDNFTNFGRGNANTTERWSTPWPVRQNAVP